MNVVLTSPDESPGGGGGYGGVGCNKASQASVPPRDRVLLLPRLSPTSYFPSPPFSTLSAPPHLPPSIMPLCIVMWPG